MMSNRAIAASFGTGLAFLVSSCNCKNEESAATARESAIREIQIQGTIDDPMLEVTPFTGGLDSEILDHDLVSACFQEITDAYSGGDGLDQGELCFNDNDTGLLDQSDCDEDAGFDPLCMMLLHECAANKFMEIASEVRQYELNGFLRLEVDGEGELTRNPIGEFPEVSYVVPPQSPEGRIEAHRLAMLNFALAARDASRILTSVEFPNCFPELMETIDEEDPNNLATVFAVAIGDVASGLSETGRKLAESQLQVAADASQDVRDFASGRQDVWNALAISHRAAADSLAGARRFLDENTGQMTYGGNVCAQPIDSDSVEAAIDLMRSTPVRQIIDEATDDDVVTAMRTVLAFQLPDIYASDTNQTFLERHTLTMDDVAQARRYLNDEMLVFRRTSRTLQEVDVDEDELPDYELVAGLASPPTPLPIACWVATTAGRRTVSSEVVSDPDYIGDTSILPEEDADPVHAIQSLDLLRWTARKILRDDDLDETLRVHFSAAAEIAEAETGHFRIDIERESSLDDEDLIVRIHGVEDAEEVGVPAQFKLVRSVDGLRCVTTGSIEGVPCAPASFYIDAIESGTDLEDEQQMQGTVRLAVDGSDVPSTSTDVYVVRLADTEADRSLAVLGGFRAPASGLASVWRMFPVGGGLWDEVESALSPATEECGRPTETCAGLRMDMIVPLESEVAQGSDPNVEDSWRHYLDLADTMSREADALGEELIQAGTEMDVRAEEARDQMEEICGGVINVDSIGGGAGGDPEELLEGADPSLANCLGDPDGGDVAKLVSLGSEPLCAWAYGSAPACTCPEGASCPDDLVPCPAPLHADGTGCPFEDGDPSPNVVVIGDGNGPAIERLNLFTTAAELSDDPSENVPPAPGVPDCRPLAKLRSGTATVTERNLAIHALERAAWATPATLGALMSVARYDEDWRDALDVTVNGTTLISTSAQAAVPPCADPAIPVVQLEALRVAAPELFDMNVYAQQVENDSIDCGDLQWDAHDDDHDNDILDIRQYTARARRAFGTLGLLVGQLDENLTRSWSVPTSFGCDDLPDPSIERECSNWALDDDMARHGCASLEQGCRCLETFEGVDPEDFPDPEGPNSNFGNVTCPELEHGGDEDADNVRLDASVIARQRREGGSVINRIWGPYDPLDSEKTVLDIIADGAKDTRTGFPFGDIVNFESRDFRCPGIFYQPVTPPAITHCNFGQVADDAAAVTHEDVFNALSLACYMVYLTGGGCETFDVSAPPPVNDAHDIQGMENYLSCAAQSIEKSAGRNLLQDLPRVLVDSIGSAQPLQAYPAYQGEMLTAIGALQNDIEEMAGLASSISGEMRSMALSAGLTRDQLEANEIESQIAGLNTLMQQISMAAQTCSNAVNPLSAADALLSGAAMGINARIGSLQAKLGDAKASEILTSFAATAGDSMSRLSALNTQIRQVVIRMNVDIGAIQQLRNRALSLAARVTFADSDEAGRYYPVNTVMRSRFNTLRIRYERARDRARAMAFIARRAIEQRFGVDLEEIERELTLVEAPSTWANDLCTFEGIDYAAIREAQSGLPEEGDALADEAPVPDNYVDGYLGEYVTKLRLFVESYPFDYPFQDGTDVAVLSLRDDLYGTKTECEVEVPNLIASSERIVDPEAEGVLPVWTVQGCPLDVDEESDGFGEPISCLMLESEPDVLEEGRIGNRIADSLREEVEEYTGFVQQDIVVDDAPSFVYLSWKHMVTDADVLNLTYTVRLEHLGTGEFVEDDFTIGAVDTVGAPHLGPLEVTQPGVLRLTIDPSAESHVGRGDVWISELQLETMPPGEEDDPSYERSEYMPTNRFGLGFKSVCTDIDGVVMRGQFFARRCQNICAAGFGHDCSPESGNVISERCFYEATFGMNLEEIERGDLIPSGNIALGNFNYRHEQVAVNLVGTNVRDCANSENPSLCYSNAFVPYTLVHEGNVNVRNHDGQTYAFSLERGFIEHGKGLASEVVLTNPLTSSNETLLGHYFKREFQGRPIMGSYTIRIWDDGSLNWENVEDIQLVFKYRYWTRFEH